MHAQEVVQEVLAPRKRWKEVKLRFIRKKLKILSARNRKKLRVLP